MMTFRNGLVAGLSTATLLIAAGPSFIPDATFRGSALGGWQPLGDADWQASNGEIIGTPKSAAGAWLFMDHGLQDLGLYASFRCGAGCKTGIMVRGQKTPEGMKGFLVSLSEGEVGLYRITLDSQGHETGREKLRTAQQLSRFGEPRQAAAPPPAPAGGRAPNAAAPQPEFGGRGRRGPALHADDWNNVQFMLDAELLRGTLNGSPAPGSGWTEDDSAEFGPIGLYVGGTGEVHFKDLAYKDLTVREEPAEKTSTDFRLQRLDEFYYSWGVAAADINRDGVMDLVAGPYYYLGPDYTKRREIYAASTFSPSSQFVNNSWLNFAADFNGDGWPGAITAGAGKPVLLFINPKGQPRRWDQYVVIPQSNTEISLLKDIDGDGHPDLVLGIGGVLLWAAPDPANPTAQWVIHHVTATGWYEQPPKGSTQDTWTFHPESFGGRGGPEMAVYHVKGDGLANIVTALDAHRFGLAWYEQKRDAEGKISFVQHMIMDDFWSKDAGGVTFTELHGSTSGDVDGDGIPDFIVGKRYWSHEDSYTDPDPHGAPVLYWYKTVRNKRAPGGAEFVPQLTGPPKQFHDF